MSIDERERLLRRMMMEIMARSHQGGQRVELSDEEVIRRIKESVRGDRGLEIINKALELYGKSAVALFRELVKLMSEGKLRELWDHELYQILERAGMRIPLKSRIRIVRHGREETIG